MVEKMKVLFDIEKISGLLERADELQKEITAASKGKNHAWHAVHEKLRYSWTYNSNAIEGSTLSEGETIFFLKEGLTVEGKPFRDFLDAKNHHEAIDYLFDIIKGNREISEGLIKEINALLLKGVTSTKAIDQLGRQIDKKATPGEYKVFPNHVLQADGTVHYYVDPVKVRDEMQNLVKWIKESADKIHPVAVSAAAHYDFVRIHPFDDGNGRGARILMNLILIQEGFPPAIIKNEKRREYIQALSEADRGELNPFMRFVAQSLIDTQQMIINELKSAP